MCGDWVMRTDVTDPHPVQVARVEIDNDHNLWVKDDPENKGINFKYLEFKDCQPIPIYSDLLSTNGFVKQGMSHIIHMTDYHVYVIWRANSINVRVMDANKGEITSCYVGYLHELQHVLLHCNVKLKWVL